MIHISINNALTIEKSTAGLLQFVVTERKTVL